jgi:hypothetical protein
VARKTQHPAPHLIEIPNSAVVKQARGFMAKTDWRIAEGATTVIRFHPSWCHMQPWVLCALGAWALKAQDNGVEIVLENDASAMYAWRFRLADLLGYELVVPIEEHDETGRFIPLKVIRTAADHRGLIADVAPLLHLSEAPERAKAVQYVVSEMVRNVLEHSSSPHGAVVAAQLYRGERGDRPYVSIGVADAGVGIQATLSRNVPDLDTDAKAILSAIQFGTTGAVPGVYGTPENAGAGLFYTRGLSAATNGYFAVASGDALFRTSRARQLPLDSTLVFPIAPYPGTIVCAEIGLDRPIDLNEFLADTRDAFIEASQRTADQASKLVRFG